jgi:UDP-N-acetylglucosamine 2-epimerase (non-hydrolysing)
MKPKKILVVFGTRPEVVKLAPVIRAIEKTPGLRPVLCATAQHRGMLDQMTEAFALRPDHDLNLMRPGQTPDEVAERVLASLRPVLSRESPDLLMVQGDTTTAAAAALAAFYRGVPVAHVEAGLRSFNPADPFPEEINRSLVDRFAALLFAPTSRSKRNLLREGAAASRIFVTGNTAVDALKWALDREPAPEAASGEKTVLVTLHRRESFGKPLEGLFRALREIVDRHPDARIVYPVHPNPSVKGLAGRMLSHERISLRPPAGYFDMVRLMRSCLFILTDSGGIQEEAPTLGKPVLVARNATERPEVLEAGAARLVGTNPARVFREASRLLKDGRLRRRMSGVKNPYGDGRAAERIASAVRAFLKTP